MGEWIQKVNEIVRSSIEFFKEAWQELKKIHWPSRKETYVATLVVVVVVLIIASYLTVVDYFLTRAVRKILS
jgi:preprotein translocase subunit SecE